jgi:lon-related putative ATP-dependent protease
LRAKKQAGEKILENELTAEKLRRKCDPNFIQCETTKELVPLREIIGQERAARALKFGLGIKDHGFNIYAAGFPGTGRTTAVRNLLEEVARIQPAPPDWCYVNNFSNEYAPKALKLPPGRGKNFQKDMKSFIDEAKRAIPKAFESEDYAAKREATIKSVEAQSKALIDELNKKAQEEGFIIQSTRIGLILIPVIKGKPVSDREFVALPQKVKDEIQKNRERLGSELRSAMRQFADIDRKVHEEIEKVDREVALYAIDHLIADLADKYKELPDVGNYLKDVQTDILDNVSLFMKEPETPPQAPFPLPLMKESPFRKYEVNVIVDNSDAKGAPVISESNPTYQNLFGRIESEAQFGALVTDFTMIRRGSLHRANGGYLVLPVEGLLINPLSYDSLKRALRNGHIVIEEAQERIAFITTKSLKPEPIPLNVKVILIGDPVLYQELYTLDREFSELFKVKADFDTTMERTDENMLRYGAFVCTLCQKENLKHLNGYGLAKLIEYSSRLAEDQTKMSTRFAEVADIVREANFYASQENSDTVTGDHVKKAIEEKIYRSKLIQEKIQEMIKREILLIDTDITAPGQVNGLSVIGLGDFEFGIPSRVTASVGLGREGIVDIEREAKMGGPIHTKGVLILSGYLNEKHAQDKPLSLSARLVFEQNYEGIEGDSASSTELYAILSALSGLPIKQSIAVTGSVNQKGEVQAIGGVNEKIEGFYEVCKTKGLTGQQGVMIPESNVQNLMLKEEILDAVKERKFHIYAVKTIDQGIETLTGIKAGARRKDGSFEKETVSYRVDKRLREMAERLREFPQSLIEERKKAQS